MAPDNEEICRRLNKTDGLIDELFKVMNSVLEWKNKICGGITVLVWTLGITQSVVLILLGIAASKLNTTAETLGNHAVELGKARTEIDHYMREPKYTRNDAETAHAQLRAWVTEKINQRQQ